MHQNERNEKNDYMEYKNHFLNQYFMVIFNERHQHIEIFQLILIHCHLYMFIVLRFLVQRNDMFKYENLNSSLTTFQFSFLSYYKEIKIAIDCRLNIFIVV